MQVENLDNDQRLQRETYYNEIMQNFTLNV